MAAVRLGGPFRWNRRPPSWAPCAQVLRLRDKTASHAPTIKYGRLLRPNRQCRRPSLGSHLYECWLKGRHVDVIKFNLADGSAFLVPAHKMVLSAQVFSRIFSGPLAASESAGESPYGSTTRRFRRTPSTHASRLHHNKLDVKGVDTNNRRATSSARSRARPSSYARSSSARASSSSGSASRPRRSC